MWPPLSDYVKECCLIVRCKTEVKPTGVRYRVLETWKGKYSPELFYRTPPEGYLFTNDSHGNGSPADGREIVFFFTNGNQPAFANGKLENHSAAFVVTDGNVVYASTSLPEDAGGFRKKCTLQGFKAAVKSVVEQQQKAKEPREKK